MLGAAFCATSMAQLVIDETFDTPGDFGVFTPVDQDGQPSNLEGYGNWVVGELPQEAGELYAGSTMAISMSWLEGFAPGNSNWLFSPAIEVNSDDFTFAWAATPSQGNLYMDGYRVVLSTTDADPESFTEELAVYAQNIGDDVTMFSDGIMHDSWNGDETSQAAAANGILIHRELDLSAYNGQTVYVAIHHNSDDDAFLLVDYIKAGPAGDITAVDEVVGETFEVNVFPNPTSDVVQFSITSGQTKASSIEIVNQTGQVVFNQAIQNDNSSNLTVDVSSLPAGIYFGRVNFGRNIVEKAFVVK